MTNALKRISKFPRVLSQLKKLVNKPVRIWVDIALENCQTLQQFLDVVLEIYEKKKYRDLKKAKSVVHRAKKALRDYENHLRNLRSKASRKFWLSEAEFDELMELMLINLSREEMLSLANYYLMKYQREMKRVLKKLGAKDVREAEQIIEKSAPKTFEEVIRYHYDVVDELKKFLRRNGLVTLPKEEKLVIMETPVYLRKLIPYAAYFPPAPFEKKKTGIYIVTPSKNLARNFNYANIKTTVVHEAFPGHHLQMSCAALHRSYVRHLSDPPEFIEGWAHFCEEYMVEKGFIKTPEEKFVFLKDAIWRACRVIVDIKLSTGKMSFNQAVNFLVKNAYLDREGAVAEVKRYTKSPGYQLCYLVGKHMIKELKKEFQKSLGKKFSEKKFNNILLYEGNLPLYVFWFVLDRKLK